MSAAWQKLFTGSAIRMLTFGIGALIAFFMSPFIIHSVGDRLYGTWLCVAAFIGYYGLLDLGLSSAVNHHLSAALGTNDQGYCNKVFNTALWLFTGIGLTVLLLTSCIVILVPLIVTSPEEITMFRTLFLIMGVSSALSFPSRAFIGALIARLQYKQLSSLQIMTLIIRSSCLAISLFLGYKLIAMAWITILSWLPEGMLLVYFSKRSWPGIRIFDWKSWDSSTAKSLFSYSFFSFITQLGDIFRVNLDTMVITAFVGLSAVTHYSIAAMLSRYFMDLMIAAMGIFQPVFSRQHGANDLEGIKATLFATTKISIYVASFFGFSLIAFGSPFIQLWMGPRFYDAFPCLVLLISAWMCDLWQLPSVSLLFGLSQHRFYAAFNAVEGVLNLALSLLLVQHYGILGVALGTCAPMIVMRLFVQPVYVCRISGVPYADYMYMLLQNVAIILAAVSVPLYLAQRYTAPNYLTLALGVAMFGVYYFLITWVVGLNHGEKQTIMAALKPGRKISVDPSLKLLNLSEKQMLPVSPLE